MEFRQRVLHEKPTIAVLEGSGVRCPELARGARRAQKIQTVVKCRNTSSGRPPRGRPFLFYHPKTFALRGTFIIICIGCKCHMRAGYKASLIETPG